MKGKYTKEKRSAGWLFPIGMSLYAELLLYIWTAEAFVPARFATIMVFALAFGCAMALVAGLFRGKAGKWIAVLLSTLLAVLTMVEYFLHDAFQYFMPLISIFTTAGDVAGGYSDTIISLVLRNLWRIGLMLLPIILYAFIAGGNERKMKRSLILLLATAVLYAGGIGMVHLVNIDTAQLSSAAVFDGRVKSFGLSMGVIQDLTGGTSMGQSSGGFEILETTAPPVEVTEAPAETTVPQETAEPTEPPVVYEPHTLGLDFAALAESETDDQIASVHRYLSSLTPDMENEFTGLFEGKNLILITAEAFSHAVVDPDLTPTLYRMVTEGIHFTDYYHQLWGCGTTGGEFANLLGLVPYGGTNTMMEVVEQDMFLTMGNQLQKLGYVSAAFHNNDHTYYNRHKTHTELGYDRFYAWGNGMEKEISPGWTRSDEEMFQVTLPQYLEQDQPFSLYYMTVSGHSPYEVNSNTMAKKNYELVKDLPYSEFVKGYLACNMDLELAMAYTISALEEAGIADDTVIVISTDHYLDGLAPSETWGNHDFLAELYGANWNKDLTRDRNALIIWSGCLEDMDLVVEDPVTALDILPTLSNLFGLEYDSRLLAGRDVFSDSEPLVFWPLNYSWKTDKGFYNGKTGEFTPAEGAEIPEGYVELISAKVKNKTVYCKTVQYQNYFNVISELVYPPEQEASEAP